MPTGNQRLKIGDAAPDYTLLDSEGRAVSLREAWASGPTLLTFLRHFG